MVYVIENRWGGDPMNHTSGQLAIPGIEEHMEVIDEIQDHMEEMDEPEGGGDLQE